MKLCIQLLRKKPSVPNFVFAKFIFTWLLVGIFHFYMNTDHFIFTWLLAGIFHFHAEWHFSVNAKQNVLFSLNTEENVSFLPECWTECLTNLFVNAQRGVLFLPACPKSTGTWTSRCQGFLPGHKTQSFDTWPVSIEIKHAVVQC